MTSAFATGLATIHSNDTILDVWFPDPKLSDDVRESGTEFPDKVPAELHPLTHIDAARETRREVVYTQIASLDDAPQDAFDAYLRLHLLSHRLVKPHGLNLDGVFGLLANVVWTNHGPCLPAGFEATRAKLQTRGPVVVYGVDKFPRMVDYVMPTGVRIGDADRVRLGAHLAEGTTVMHEGFVNFNAGTLGNSMVEGRISAGVVVDDGTDIGGGASIMGTCRAAARRLFRWGSAACWGRTPVAGFLWGMIAWWRLACM